MKTLTRRFLSNSLLFAGAVILSGCNMFGKNDETSLVPPSAVYQPGSIQSPMYPPTGFNNPNLVAGNTLPQPSTDTPLPDTRFEAPAPDAGQATDIIPNSPMLTPNNIIELSAVGMGVAPESTVSPSQALALAKRAAIVDAYRQLGEKMYGIRVNAQDTVRDMILQNSTVKTKVQALIRNAEITETVYKDGLCQVSMELKLDGRIWYRALSGGRNNVLF
ncbi:LPP20 family lipoprotein [Helicobacter mustelae]|uniref:Putative lipoprotein n=1 Tax=Helicobacter mustelae (strain ATCC 43772 / CCUG 25715 / CIP 103759 / LMG 18044 / NCTC 12198 / R85-136P) TaxID=679897 RepID=D3UJ72_HELM1|nr:LPP20 family lipoprotein [Helicobacter mustelae]CBG40547.1 putative lipoprotein [Helicobacter mustelae 12198]SQH72045.1 lipoprotein [Helicobacter mustelae]STP13188.1 lipoprotein [Helicobacter mustelae]